MKNKLLIELIVPEIDEKYNLFIPINKKIGNVIVLLNKLICDLSNGQYIGSTKSCIYNRKTGVRYDIDELIRNTDIRNGSSLVLL